MLGKTSDQPAMQVRMITLEMEMSETRNKRRRRDRQLQIDRFPPLPPLVSPQSPLLFSHHSPEVEYVEFIQASASNRSTDCVLTGVTLMDPEYLLAYLGI